jgi:hypothetical protein
LEKKYLSTHTTKEGKKNLPQKLNLQKHRTVTTHTKNAAKTTTISTKTTKSTKNPMRNKLAAPAEAQLQTLQQQENQ